MINQKKFKILLRKHWPIYRFYAKRQKLLKLKSPMDREKLFFDRKNAQMDLFLARWKCFWHIPKPI